MVATADELMPTTETFLGLTSTGWTALTALATALLVLAGVATVAAAIGDSRDRNRPVLTPELELTKWGDGLDLAITNHGASPASNVLVEFTKDYVDAKAPAGSNAELYKEYLLKKYSKPIHTWGPGQKEVNGWILGTEHQKAIEGLPKDDEVITISYDRRSIFNLVPRVNRRYKETFPVAMVKRMHDLTTTSSRDLDQQMKEVIQQLKGIAQAIANSGR